MLSIIKSLFRETTTTVVLPQPTQPEIITDATIIREKTKQYLVKVLELNGSTDQEIGDFLQHYERQSICSQSLM
jgi:hypothetical protein